MWLSSASRCGAGGWGVWDGRSVGRGYRARTSSNVQAAADTHVVACASTVHGRGRLLHRHSSPGHVCGRHVSDYLCACCGVVEGVMAAH